MAPNITSFQTLTAMCDGRLIAVPETAVGSIATGRGTPPPPWSLPWVGGLTEIDGQTYLVVSLFGCEPTVQPDRAMTLLLITGPHPIRIAILVQSVGAFATATTLAVADRPSPVCPHGWLRSCRLMDGRDAVLVDGTAMVASVWADVA